MQIKEQQQRDSIRLVWNSMPTTKSLQSKAVISQALHYTLLDYNSDSLLTKTPPTCSNCQSYMNPYNPIHIGKQYYTCCICKSTNPVPPNYLEGKDIMPPQMTLAYSSFLLARDNNSGGHIGMYFVVDIAVADKELQAIKRAIVQLVNHLEDDRAVGLITYNKYVQIYDLASQIPTTIVFSPNQQYNDVQFMDFLALGHHKIDQLKRRYTVPLGQCRAAFIQRVNKLQRIKHSYKNQRESRAVGQALHVALSLSHISSPSKIIFFCGGICTIGVGKVIQTDFKVEVRSIKEQLPKQSVEAIQFFRKLGQKAKQKSIAIDSFIFSVEEVGLTEMLPCLTATNGLLVQHEQFDSQVFHQSFSKAYIQNQKRMPLSLATQASIQLKFSKQIALTGFQGEEKQQKTNIPNQYYLGNISENTTITVTFEQKQIQTQSQAFYFQIKSTFKDVNHLNITFQRITTIRRLFAHTATDIIASFDQEAALYLLTKICCRKSLKQSSENIRLWLDNLIIKWTTIFGIYQKGEAQSFRLPNNVRAFPQFIYYLRRSVLVRKNRISLDEYIYLNEIIKRETVRNVSLMIQPALLMYTTEETSAAPVGLDQKYMKSQVILVLDSFFNIVEWRGKNIQGWFQQNYHLSHEYAYMQEMYQNTTRDIQHLKHSRFPTPVVYLTWPGHSKERFIKSRLGTRQQQQQQGNLSQQADINSFTSKLIQIAVSK